MRTFRIFLSSPGDCEAERNAALVVLQRLNADPLIAQFARLEIVAWDWGTGVPFDALASPQVSVNNRMPVPEECDVYIGIFRGRFGSPIPLNEFRKDDGTPFRSGSEYEFDRAWKARRLGAKTPELYVYRLRNPDPATNDAGQLSLLSAFFDAAPFKNQGQWTGSVNWFDATADFERQLDGHLRTILSKSHPHAKQPLQEWLESMARRVEHDAGPRYTRESHVESGILSVFDWLLARPSAVQMLDGMLSKSWDDIQHTEFEPVHNDMLRIASNLRELPTWINQPPNFELIDRTLAAVAETARTVRQAAYSGQELSHGLELSALGRIADISLRRQGSIGTYSAYTARRVMLLTGPAGQGKTHTLVHELRRVRASGGIALGVMGQTLSSSSDLRSALIQAWGTREASFDSLLDVLNSAAVQTGQRGLIVIDALNETPNRTRWKHELNGIIRDILARPHLTLAISVRSDYKAYVLPDIDPQHPLWEEHIHRGFAGIEPEALKAYCAHYGIKAPVAPLIGEMSNPLYVQLLVKSLTGRDTPAHWLPSWLDVWEAWIERLEADARGQLPLDPSRRHPIRRTLNKIAAAMIESGKYSLLRSEADAIALSTAGIDRLVEFLCSAGAVMTRIENDDDIVEFGFERLSETFIADRLLQQLFDGQDDLTQRQDLLKSALSPGGKLEWLATPHQANAPLAARRAGLLSALCLAAPKHARIELPSLIPVEPADEEGWISIDRELRQAVTDSMRWRCAPGEFAADKRALWKMYRQRGAQLSQGDDLDELIRLALIPGHPFEMANYLHPRLARMRSVGARDAYWTIDLIEPASQDGSNLSGLVRWAKDSDLTGVGTDLALVAARLLAWVCASSQQRLREHATRSLTRVLVACPDILPVILTDFLPVNDDYILESVLAATWGVLIAGRNQGACAQAAQQVHEAIFTSGTPHCHLTIRHYARRIVEAASDKGWIGNIDRSTVLPPYQSSLPLGIVPSAEILRAQATSHGYGRIVGSAMGHDFYWYVMGATSGSKPFSSSPLPTSSEPVREFRSSADTPASRTPSGIFDIPLAACFVVWNCQRLGWTAERFEEFDTGAHVRSQRIESPGRTERIGKKYQWIGWQTMLAFLADNYCMTPGYGGHPRTYDSPAQISYIELFDPSRWLEAIPKAALKSLGNSFWTIPSMPRWPSIEVDDIRRWGASDACGLPPTDILNHESSFPPEWGDGPWICVVAENVWQRPPIPGLWGLGQEQDVDIWWQITPGLIRTSDLPGLLAAMQMPELQERMTGWGRVDLPSYSDVRLSEWPELKVDPEEYTEFDRIGLALASIPLAGRCGSPDDWDEGDQEIILPLPAIFQSWGLTLDLQHGVVRWGDTIIFGLVGQVMGCKALVARRDALMEMLQRNECTLIWLLRGERKAVLQTSGSLEPEFPVWVDSYGIAYLAQDGRAQVAWLDHDRRMTEPDVPSSNC